MATKKKKTLKWYYSGGGIYCSGPFASEAEAWETFRLTPEESRRHNSIHLPGSRVWPSYRDFKEEVGTYEH